MIPIPINTLLLLPATRVVIGDTDYIDRVNKLFDLIEHIAQNQQAMADNFKYCGV